MAIMLVVVSVQCDVRLRSVGYSSSLHRYVCVCVYVCSWADILGFYDAATPVGKYAFSVRFTVSKPFEAGKRTLIGHKPIS